MSSAAAVGEIAVGRFMCCYSGKSRACGARRFFLLRTQALRPGLNCAAPPALGNDRKRRPRKNRRGRYIGKTELRISEQIKRDSSLRRPTLSQE